MTDWLDWPFFDSRHRQLGAEIAGWASANLIPSHGNDVEAEVRALVAKLGASGFLGLTIADGALDVRSLAIARSTLAYHSGLADFAFAMQGLGSGAISLFGNARQRAHLGLDIVAVRGGQVGARPGGNLGAKLAVARIEERPVEPVSHP